MLKPFIAKVVAFITLIVIILMISIFVVPSPEMSGSLLAMGPVKHALLRETRPPRIILVGGSNLSHGLNSQVLKDAFNLPVINMGLHGGLGLWFMLEEIRPFVQKDDIVIVTPEYAQFEESGFWGNKELLGLLFDVMPELRQRISVEQGLHLLKYVPNYAAKKALNAVIHLFHRKTSVPDIRQEYNAFGDHIGHWDQAPLRVPPVAQVKNVKLSKTCFDSLESFVREMREKDARVGLMAPCFQASSYDHSLPLIERVEQELRKRELPLLAPMRRYRIDDHFCYDTPYHLVKKGVGIRTQLFVEDLAPLLAVSDQ